MKRRSFILLTGLGLSAAALSFIKLFNLDFINGTEYAKPKLLSKICNDETIRFLGQLYVELMPAERNREWLMRELYGGSVKMATLREKKLLLMQTQLENSIRKDFADRATVILKGWILSLTEARQCALFFILNS